MSHIIQTKKLTKKFGHKFAVKNLSIAIEPGEVYGFLGPNGAGKTTTIRMIMDFIRPTSGEVKLFGKPISEIGHAVFENIGYLSSDSTLYSNWTASQHLKYMEKIRGNSEKTDDLIKQFGLELNVKVHRLSSGNKQKLKLIMALMHSPKLLVMDEPTRGLDPILQNDIHYILKKLSKEGSAVFMSSHDMNEVEQVCDRVGIIKEGEIVTSQALSDLRELNIHVVKVVFGGKFDLERYSTIPNVEIKKTTKHELIINVKGDLNPFLYQLGKSGSVKDIDIYHSSLEDVFMRYYK